MYVRMARFEGATLPDLETAADLIRRDIEAAQRGDDVRYLQADLARVVDRLELMVNRQDGSVAVLMYCDSIQKAGEADRILASMRPRHNGWGERVSADIYEIVLDERPRVLRAA